MRTFVRWSAAFLVAVSPRAGASQQPARWTIEPKPVVTIGATEADTNDLLTTVVGATRLGDGRILVGDHGSFALRLYSQDGKPLRAFGRKGKGPGEVSYLKSLLRCGDSLVTLDVDGNRTSVFSPGGEYVRAFRFGSPQAGRPSYATVCNGGGTFAHFGWETIADMKPGVYRASVPFWLSGADSAVRHVLGAFPGSERYGLAVGGQIRGSRPLPLGREPRVALAADRVYIGTADRYEILVFDLAGRPMPPVRAERPVARTSDADIRNARALELSGVPEGRRARAALSFDELPLPKTLPAYAVLRVDAVGNLWVQDYPRATSSTVRWSVFDTQGRLIAEATLPAYLEVYEIGVDYVLGRFLDPEESVPQVRLYRLHR